MHNPIYLAVLIGLQSTEALSSIKIIPKQLCMDASGNLRPRRDLYGL